MTSSKANIFRVTGPLWGESHGRGIPRSSLDSPHKWQWLRYLLFSLICAWTNNWANILDADDLRRHRIHYDVTVMKATFNLIESIPKHHQPVKAIGSGNIIDAIRRLGTTVIASDNGLGPTRCQAIAWTNADALSTRPIETEFCESKYKHNETLSSCKMHFKMPSAYFQPFESVLSVLEVCDRVHYGGKPTLNILIDTSNLKDWFCIFWFHYSNVIMSAMVSQIAGVSIVYSTVCSGTDQRKHQRSASLAFVRGIHWWRVNSPHKGPVTRKMFQFDDVIMPYLCCIFSESNNILFS